MYEHLLVALDGSPTAERVLEHAEALAGAFGSRVTLVRATAAAEVLLAQTAGTGPGLGGMTPALDPTPIMDAEHDATRDYLAGVVARLRQHQVNVDAEQHEGPAADVIVRRAEALGVGLILMTTHGRSGLGRVVFGSVADSVLRHATCPVLLVRVTPQQEEEDQAGGEASATPRRADDQASATPRQAGEQARATPGRERGQARATAGQEGGPATASAS